MKNFIQHGDSVTVAAPYALSSGGGAKVGAIFGVATADAANAATVVLKRLGLFELAKAASQAWTVGQAIYWDNTNKVATSVATGNMFIGHATEAVADGAGDTKGKVVLTPAAGGDDATSAAIASLVDGSGGVVDAEQDIVALPALTDSPATVDALRDDIMTNWAPKIAANHATLAAKIEEILDALRADKVIAT